MMKPAGIFLSLLLSPLALANGDSDAVNERIPVTDSEMEAHWQVNCAAARDRVRVRAATAGQEDSDACGLSADLVREIRLCGYIYQPPGEHALHQCPDYRGASQELDRDRKLMPCAALLHSLDSKLDCSGAIPTAERE